MAGLLKSTPAADSRPGRLLSDRWLLLLLAAGLGLRLVEVTAPLIDHQAWRQADTAAIARNFHEEGLTLFHPRVDWRGNTPGYVEMNLPLFPFLAACLYSLAGGAHEWIGRLLAALFSTAAAVPLYCLARAWLGSAAGARLAAAIYLMLPLSLFFGRAFMPEALMLLLSAAALSAFGRACREGTAWLLAAAGIAGLCFALKIPTLYLGFPLVAMALGRWGPAFVRRGSLWLYLLAAVAPAAAWHVHAAGLFEQTGLTFGIWGRRGYDKWSHDLLLQGGFYHLMAGRFVEAVLTPMGVLLAAVGLVGLWPRGAGGPRQGREVWPLYAWFGGLLLYLFMIPEGNRRLHYYQLPFTLPAAVLAAAPLAALWEPGGARLSGVAGRQLRRLRPGSPGARAVVGLALAAVAAGSLWKVGDYYRPGNNIYNYYRSCELAGRVLDARMPADARLVTGDIDEDRGGPFRTRSPTLLYYCHRKGWQITPDLFEASRLDSLAAEGADYFVVAAGFVKRAEPLWSQLLARGVTTAAAYPDFRTDERSFRRQARSVEGPERNILVVRLVDNSPAGN